MGWKGLERDKLDYILTDLLPVELSEMFSFRPFYDFLMQNEYSDAIVHPFRKFSASLSGETEHCFPDRVQSLN